MKEFSWLTKPWNASGNAIGVSIGRLVVAGHEENTWGSMSGEYSMTMGALRRGPWREDYQELCPRPLSRGVTDTSLILCR